MSEAKTHEGGCQCGKVRYRVSIDLTAPVIACNCSIGKGRDGGDNVAINVRCLDGVELDTLNVTKFDGRGR